jgi:hypothetical protein
MLTGFESSGRLFPARAWTFEFEAYSAFELSIGYGGGIFAAY